MKSESEVREGQSQDLASQSHESPRPAPPRFALSGQCDNDAHSHCPYPERCRCVCHTDDPHPEDKCRKCGGPNCVWFAPSPLWNKAVRAKGEPEILCPVCFVRLAEESGVKTTAWAVAPERPVGDYKDAAIELAEWIGIHPKWSRESVIHTIETAFADVANQRAIDAAKDIVATTLNATEREAEITTAE